MVEVNVKQGTLRGVEIENIEGGKYVVFQGIPYAETPAGLLRFQDPRPPLPWTGVRNAFEKGNKAAQIHARTGEIVGEDDCLYLNVASNSLSGKKPVMVWIHGGAFAYSSADLDYFGPDYLLKHDIVFVSLNYRVGIFGFLNMDLEYCAGNQGLKDQISALLWIQENIETFGGDKKNVTIFGGSSGSVSVHCLCISPLSKGLFQKAICQSGVVINPNSFQTSNKEFVFEILATLGKKTSNPKEAVKFLCTLPVQEILKAELKLLTDLNEFFLHGSFLPSLDTSSANPIFPKPLNDLVKNGINIPLLIGFNSHDGMSVNFDEAEKTIRRLDESFEDILESRLNLNELIDVSKFARDVRNFYFKKKSITIKEREMIMQYRGDVCFINGIQFVVENQMQKETPTFVYRFSYKADDSLLMRRPIDKKIQGASHAEDNFFLFYRPILGKERQLKRGTEDYLTMLRMTKMWTNFAKTGDPTPEIDGIITTKWKPISEKMKCYLEINDQILLGENPNHASWKLWKPVWMHKDTYCNLYM